MPRSRFDDALRLFEIYRGYIQHEDALVDARTTWFIQLHSFLIASYGLVFAAAVSTFSDEFGRSDASLWLQWMAASLLGAITLIGLVSSLAANLSVAAARTAVEGVKAIGASVLADYEPAKLLPELTGGGSSAAETKGAYLSRLLPWSLTGLWVASLAIPFALVVLSQRAPTPQTAPERAAPQASR